MTREWRRMFGNRAPEPCCHCRGHSGPATHVVWSPCVGHEPCYSVFCTTCFEVQLSWPERPDGGYTYAAIGAHSTLTSQDAAIADAYARRLPLPEVTMTIPGTDTTIAWDLGRLAHAPSILWDGGPTGQGWAVLTVAGLALVAYLAGRARRPKSGGAT